jgi:hypothetical protein
MEASGTGFKVLQFDWNPQGHEPPGVYDLPHFDFHFYYISDAERLAIPANETYPVAPQFLPAAYSQPGPTVPEMGGHALDLTGPEFNGGVFGQTFIYGYNRGQEIFLEPMLTKAYLEALSSVARFNIRQPSQYTISTLPALVPTTGEYAYDSATDTYTIRVGDFVSLVAVLPNPEHCSCQFSVFRQCSCSVHAGGNAINSSWTTRHPEFAGFDTGWPMRFDSSPECTSSLDHVWMSRRR